MDSICIHCSEREVKRMDLKGKKICFLGDSITEGAGCSCREALFTARIAREYGAVCLNYGISGTRIARQRVPSEDPRNDLDFAGRFEEMDPEADAVVVFGGTNDFGHGDAPIGTMEDRTPDTFYGALHFLYRGLLERYPAIPIAVLTPLHRLGEEDPRGSRGKPVPALPLAGYVQIIRRVAEYYSLPVLDLFACSGLQPDVPSIRNGYVPDGLHPNDDGHRILAGKIGRFLSLL